MIRDRIGNDFDALCNILMEMKHPSGSHSKEEFREWLEEYDAEQSWVYDMAPVKVTPTKNAVGHVQIRRADKDTATPYWVDHTKRPDDRLLVIDRLFVKPIDHQYGIGRYLVKESIRYIQDQDKLPVVGLHRNASFPKRFYEKYGFEEIPSDNPDIVPMIYSN